MNQIDDRLYLCPKCSHLMHVKPLESAGVTKCMSDTCDYIEMPGSAMATTYFGAALREYYKELGITKFELGGKVLSPDLVFSPRGMLFMFIESGYELQQTMLRNTVFQSVHFDAVKDAYSPSLHRVVLNPADDTSLTDLKNNLFNQLVFSTYAADHIFSLNLNAEHTNRFTIDLGTHESFKLISETVFPDVFNDKPSHAPTP